MVLGVDHSDTLRSLHGLAQLFTDMGNYDLALPLYEELLYNRGEFDAALPF